MEIEILREDTTDALTTKLEHKEAAMESYLAQLHQLSFDTDVLTAEHLKVCMRCERNANSPVNANANANANVPMCQMPNAQMLKDLWCAFE